VFKTLCDILIINPFEYESIKWEDVPKELPFGDDLHTLSDLLNPYRHFHLERIKHIKSKGIKINFDLSFAEEFLNTI